MEHIKNTVPQGGGMSTDQQDVIRNLHEQYQKYYKNTYPMRLEPWRQVVLRELKARIEKYGESKDVDRGTVV